jgi:FHS family glucose/mannose:H+ symporter-like MFS transporter
MSLAMFSGFFSVFVFGILMAFLGSIKLKLTRQIGADDAQFGKIVAVFQWTMVVMAIVGGIILDNIGHRIVIILGMILASAAIFWIGRQRTIGAVMAGCVLLGIGGQFVNLAGNTLLPNLFSDPSAGSNLGNTFFGLGALLIPIITAYLFQRGSFSRALSVVALICLVPVVVAISASFPVLEKSFSATVAVGLLGNVVTWLSALTLFCYIGLEVSMAVWITTYATEIGASEEKASQTLSLFFIAMMLGRLFFGLQDRITGVDLTPMGIYIMSGAALLAALALTLMMNTSQLSTGRWAVAMAGFVFGPIFPTTVGVTFQHFDASQWGTLFGIVFAVGLIGASTIPAWIGSMAKGKSVKAGLNILRITALILAVVAVALNLV